MIKAGDSKQKWDVRAENKHNTTQHCRHCDTNCPQVVFVKKNQVFTLL